MRPFLEYPSRDQAKQDEREQAEDALVTSSTAERQRRVKKLRPT